jgi:ribosome-binding protein aMBF1 (putative translation factor)
VRALKELKPLQQNGKITRDKPEPPLFLPVEHAIRKLGQDISLARRRRHISQTSLAERIGASVSTVRRIEQGDARVPIHFIARAMLVFGVLENLSQALDTARDDIGLTMVDLQLPLRVRSKRSVSPSSGAL